MKKIKKIMWFMLLIVTLCVGYTLSVDASDMSADYDFDEIDELISNESDGEYSFSEIVDGICEGENGIISNTADMIWKSVTNEVSNNKEMIVRTILIAISMSILSNILSVFDNKDYSKTSYYIVYLLLMVTLISAFKEIVGIAGGMLEKIVTFMECLVPSFFLAVGVSFSLAAAMVPLGSRNFVAEAADPTATEIKLPLQVFATKEQLIELPRACSHKKSIKNQR